MTNTMTDNDKIELPSLTLPENSTVDRDSINFSERVKYMRSHLGLTLKALSLVTKVVDPHKQGISTVSISRYESGAEPGMRELKLLSLAFFRPISYLVYGDSDDPMHHTERHLASLDLLIDDMVASTVHSILENKGIIKTKKTIDLRDRKQYAAMIEEVKKLAK